MKTLENYLPRRLGVLLAGVGLLVALPVLAAPGSTSGITYTPHYRVALGVAPIQSLAGTPTLQVLNQSYARYHGARTLADSAAVESGNGQVITAAVYTRADGRQLHHLQVMATVTPASSWSQGTRQSMYPLDINGYVTYDTVVPMAQGTYTVRLAISDPSEGRHEVATFRRSIP